MLTLKKYKVVKAGKKFKVGEFVYLVPTKSKFEGVVMATNGYQSHYINVARLAFLSESIIN